jgi:hypothetical protein
MTARADALAHAFHIYAQIYKEKGTSFDEKFPGVWDRFWTMHERHKLKECEAILKEIATKLQEDSNGWSARDSEGHP